MATQGEEIRVAQSGSSKLETGNGEGRKRDEKIILIGAGTIGLSLAALHLQFLSDAGNLTIHDTRPDFRKYVSNNLSKLLPPELHGSIPKIKLSNSSETLPDALKDATIIQEQGPENLPFKRSIWSEVDKYARPDALLWTSTSGIPASAQGESLKPSTRERLVVVHPYNPPHILPLLEVVPSPSTSQDTLDRTLSFWRSRGRQPVVIHKEIRGFIANRLAFALLREAIHLVKEGVVSVEDCDTIVTSSMGPRWAIWGPFKAYQAGGGEGGMKALFDNIGGTVQECWDDAGAVNVGEGWEDDVFRQCEQAYGRPDTVDRDLKTRKVLEAVKGEEK